MCVSEKDEHLIPTRIFLILYVQTKDHHFYAVWFHGNRDWFLTNHPSYINHQDVFSSSKIYIKQSTVPWMDSSRSVWMRSRGHMNAKPIFKVEMLDSLAHCERFFFFQTFNFTHWRYLSNEAFPRKLDAFYIHTFYSKLQRLSGHLCVAPANVSVLDFPSSPSDQCCLFTYIS